MRVIWVRVVWGDHNSESYMGESGGGISIVGMVWMRVVWVNHNDESDMGESGMGESQ